MPDPHLAGLQSYHSSLVLRSEGQDDQGRSVREEFMYEADWLSSGTSHTRWEFRQGAERTQTGGGGYFRTASEGGVLYEFSPSSGACSAYARGAEPVGDLTGGGLTRPEAWFENLQLEGRFTGYETIYGMNAAHYQVISAQGPAAYRFNGPPAELSVSTDSEVILHLSGVQEGEQWILNRRARGRLVWEYNVMDINHRIDIELPAACQAVSMARLEPALPTSAVAVTASGDMVSFESDQSLDELVLFYSAWFGEHGWVSQPVESLPKSASLRAEKTGGSLQIEMTSTSSGSIVTLFHLP